MTKNFSFGIGTALTIAALVFLVAYIVAPSAHADTRRCTPTVSSSAWNGGNAAPGSRMYQVFNAAFLRN